MSRTDIRLALPSKGRLQSTTLEFLSRCGFDVRQNSTRGYMGTIPALPNVSVLFQRPRDIVVSVANGGVDFGITGLDVIHEAQAGDSVCVIHDALGFGKCRLVVAVPERWDDVNAMADLNRRGSAAKPLRVATVFPNITRQYLTERGVSHFTLVEAEGSLEVMPEIDAADLIADIVETGSTLAQNRLRPLSDGIMMHTQSALFANRASLKRPEVMQTAATVLEYIEAHLRAEGFFMIIANVRGASAEDVAHKLHTGTTLGGLQGPTVAPVYANSITPRDSGWFGITIMVRRTELTSAIEQLRRIGGSGVIVTPVAYIFEEQPDRVAALKAMGG